VPRRPTGNSKREGAIKHESLRAFVEVTDPWDAKNTIREALKRACAESVGMEDLC
jgi:hypothetical protein